MLRLAFGSFLVAILVGAFIIFNAFSITVAQRLREFAMLRSLGATRRQVLLTVLGEALLMGVFASVVGLFAGLGVARGINALFKAVGADIPTAGAIADAVWDELVSGHTTAGSAGKTLKDAKDLTIAGL